MSVRLLLVVAFAGTRYSGWQVQDNAVGVQAVIRDAVEGLLGGKARPLPVGPSRTDTGVHADAMPVHLDLEAEDRTADRWRLGLNHQLPWDIRILHAAYVPEEFHARTGALAKTYVYRFWTGTEAPPRWSPYVWQRHKVKNWPAVIETSRIFLGEHDFSSFLIPEPKRSHVRIVDSIDFFQEGQMMTMSIKSKGFARRMVRFLAGALAAVGRGDLNKQELKHILESKDNRLAPAVADACGLTLEKVHYPDIFDKYFAST